jgi:hypothetical protein
VSFQFDKGDGVVGPWHRFAYQRAGLGRLWLPKRRPTSTFHALLTIQFLTPVSSMCRAVTIRKLEASRLTQGAPQVQLAAPFKIGCLAYSVFFADYLIIGVLADFPLWSSIIFLDHIFSADRNFIPTLDVGTR